MKQEYRSIIAVALSAAFFVLWFYVINPQKKSAVQPAPEAASGQEAGADLPREDANEAGRTVVESKGRAIRSQGGFDVVREDPQASIPIKTWEIKNDLVEVKFTSAGGAPSSWRILGYHQKAGEESPLIDLVSGVRDIPPPLSISFRDSDFNFPASPRYELLSASGDELTYRWNSKEVEIKKTVIFQKDNYVADVSVEVKNKTKRTLKGRPALDWSTVSKPVVRSGLMGFIKQPSVESLTPVYYIDGKVHREGNPAKLAKRTDRAGAVYWSGMESRYFLSVIVPRVQGQGLSVAYGAEGISEGVYGMWAGAALPEVIVPPGGSSRAIFSVYAGPKERDKLKSVGVRLEEAIDYGWFSIVAVPILYLLKFFYGLIHNYGIAIILLTVFVKLLLHPINVKSLKSMKAMQQLQPRLKELQKKFKADKQRLNQETMQLFRAHKVNPMGGCLPMILQFPIYIALYKVLWNSIELFHAPFFWFYKDLSAPDPYYITPVLLGLFMVAQQKLMPSTSADPTQQKMMMIMPVMFCVFMLFLPAGLVIYILVNTVMSVTQQYMYNKGIGIMDLIRGRWRPLKA